MADFSTESEMGITIPSSELRAARQEIEDELGDITVSVEGSMAGPGAGPMAGASTDGGRRIGGRDGGAGARSMQVQIEQLEVLEDMNETLEKIGGSGGALTGGGGGGGGGGIFGSILGRGASGIGGGGAGVGLGLGALGAGALGVGTAGLGLGISLFGATNAPPIDQSQFAGDADGSLPQQALFAAGTREGSFEAVAGRRIQQQLNNLQPPDLDLGLVTEAQSFERQLNQFTAPDLDPKLLDDLTTFDSALQTVSAPDLDPGLSDAASAFEQQLNRIQPPPWLDAVGDAAEDTTQAAGSAAGQLDDAVPVDLNTSVDLDPREIRRDVERAVRRELRNFDLESTVEDIVRNQFP